RYGVYGSCVWPGYARCYWSPPGYVLGGAVIGFSVGFFVGSALWCHYNWGGGWGGGWGGPGTVNVVPYNQFNRTNFVAERNGFSNWQFNAAHRGTVGFQNATLRQQFGGQNTLQGTRGTFQGNLKGTQQGPQGQIHGMFQGNQSLLHGGTGPLNSKSNTNVNTNAH